MISNEQLKDLIINSLRACYTKDGVVASPTHFSDYWARDTFFALPGMMIAGDYDKAKDSLELFLKYQRPDGKIPRKLSRDITIIKYLFGKKISRKKPRPTYHGLIKPFYAKDSELLFVIAFAQYLEETRDYDFAEQQYRAVQKALHWHTQRLKDGFIHEHFLGNWMDTVFKFGAVLYTNVLYMRALEAMVLIAQVAGYDDEAEVYVHRARSMKRRLQKEFWNGAFFADERRLRKRKVFDLAGNVLAVVYDVADQHQKRELLCSLETFYKKHGTWVPAVPTGQRWYKINPLAYVFGMADYHTTTVWLWIVALLMHAFYDNGASARAQAMLDEVTLALERDNAVGETYFTDGTAYKKYFWHSASPFLWSSGVLLEVLVHLQVITKEKTYPKPEPRIC